MHPVVYMNLNLVAWAGFWVEFWFKNFFCHPLKSPKEVIIDFDIIKSKTIEEWCKNNIRGRWILVPTNLRSMKYIFSETEDAIHFKLVWA